MKRWAMMMMVVTFLGCAGISENQTAMMTSSPPNEMLFPKDFDKVWEAAMKSIPDLPIIRKNKASGLIASNWKNIEGKRRERLSIHFKKEDKGTRVLIQSHMEVLVKGARVETGFGSTTKIPRWIKASSDSVSSDLIFLKIKENLVEKPPEPEEGKAETETPTAEKNN